MPLKNAGNLKKFLNNCIWVYTYVSSIEISRLCGREQDSYQNLFTWFFNCSLQKQHISQSINLSKISSCWTTLQLLNTGWLCAKKLQLNESTYILWWEVDEWASFMEKQQFLQRNNSQLFNFFEDKSNLWG